MAASTSTDRTAARQTENRFGSGTGARTLNLAVNRSLQPRFRNGDLNPLNASEAHGSPGFIAGVAVPTQVVEADALGERRLNRPTRSVPACASRSLAGSGGRP